MAGFDTAIDLSQLATPARNPNAGRMFLYPKGDGKWYTLDSTGAETVLGSGGGGASGGTVAIGSIVPFAGTTAPAGFLMCDGSAVLRASYPELFTLIGTTYGAGNGSTTFNVPNLTGKVPVGLSAADTEFNALAKSGGEKAHVLTAAELADHFHQYQYSTSIQSLAGYYNQYAVNASWVASSGWNPQNATGGTTGVTGVTPNQPHNNIQPYLTVNWIIRASPTVETPVSMQAFRDTLDSNFTPTATSLATAQQVPGLSVTVNVTSPQQVWTVELSAYNSMAAGTMVEVLTVDGVTQDTQGSLVTTASGGMAETAAKTYLVTGLSVGSHTFGMKAYSPSGSHVIGGSGTSILAVGSMVGVDQTTDWRLTDFRASDFALTTTSQIIPFTQDKGGSGFVTDASGRLVVQKAGVYFIHTAFTVMQTGGTGLAWVVNNLVHRRGGVEQSRRENVVSTQPGGFATAVLTGEYDCNAGDTFEVLANSQAASTHIVNNGRGQFTGHRLSGPGPTGPPGPTGVTAGVAMSFKGSWATAVPGPGTVGATFTTPAGTLWLTCSATAWSSVSNGMQVEVYLDGVLKGTMRQGATGVSGAWQTLSQVAFSAVVTAGPHNIVYRALSGTNSDGTADGSIFGFVT